jgi:hypothetical protein
MLLIINHLPLEPATAAQFDMPATLGKIFPIKPLIVHHIPMFGGAVEVINDFNHGFLRPQCWD